MCNDVFLVSSSHSHVTEELLNITCAAHSSEKEQLSSNEVRQNETLGGGNPAATGRVYNALAVHGSPEC